MGRLRSCAKELQMLPEAAANALQLLQHPDCSIRDFAALVEKDVSLSSSVLSLANSPFYGRGRPVGCIQEAVVQVGFRQCTSLIHASCAESLMRRLSEDQSDKTRSLLIHSQICAMTAVDLSVMLKLRLDGMEYTAGILHDVGRMILSSLFPDNYFEADSVDFEESQWTEDRERSVVGTDHCVVGCMLAITNTLPDAICEAIRFHHVPERAEASPLLTALVAAADDFANYALRADQGIPYNPMANKGLQLLLDNPQVNSDKEPLDIAAELLPKILAEAPC